MKALSQADIDHIKALRAENLKRIAATTATAPWPDHEAPSRSPLAVMATRCFTGNLNASDLRYMALALLDLSDQVAELREMVRRLEEGARK